MAATRHVRLLLLLLIPLFLVGCTESPPEVPTVLADLAYSEGAEESRYTVWLPEGGELVPYLVLTDDYGGNCLLLRKFLLEEPAVFNSNVLYSGYYEDSRIDRMLSGAFRETLPEEVRALLVTVQIPITARDSLWGGEPAITELSREIFLLSAAEVSDQSWQTIAAEGQHLEYFSSRERRIGFHADGTPSSWWLRTPNTWYHNVVCGVDRTGVIGIGGVGAFGEDGEYSNGVRPAFCLKPETPIYMEDGVFLLFPSGDGSETSIIPSVQNEGGPSI